MFPVFKAWPPAARGDVRAARAALGDFSVLDIVEATGTEGLAAAAVVFAVAGNTAQRSWTYERLSKEADRAARAVLELAPRGPQRVALLFDQDLPDAADALRQR
jgi:hypothetical protein